MKLLLSVLLVANVHLCSSAACHQVPVENATGTHTACPPDSGVAAQGKLVAFFCGSSGVPPTVSNQKGSAFLKHTTSLGFHFIGLLYNAHEKSVAGFCKDIEETDPDCFEKIRLVRLFGGSYKGSHREKADGGLERLNRALPQLASAQKDEGWSEFLDNQGKLIASKVIVAGESQGSGMALMVSQYYAVDRVLQFAGVDDAYLKSGVPTAAPWVARQGWKTPATSIYGLGNTYGVACRAWHVDWPAAGIQGVTRRD